MLKKFRKNEDGNVAIMAAFLIPVFVLGAGIAIDLTEMERQRHATVYAMEAAGIAVGRQIEQGMQGEALKVYGEEFFEANLGPVEASQADLKVILPDEEGSNGDIKLITNLTFKPLFLTGQLASLYNIETQMSFQETVKVRSKNTAEIALVLDNSGSMNNRGSGSNKKRMDLLKEAASYLVNQLADEAKNIKQIVKPVQFSVVPFAASVNVGPEHANAPWMDRFGDSPIHHENFDWDTLADAFGDDFKAVKSGNRWLKTGDEWDEEEGQPLTRFTLYDRLEKVTGYNTVMTDPGTPGGWNKVCTKKYKKGKKKGQCKKWKWEYSQGRPATYEQVPVTEKVEAWKGCVEARPYPYNINGKLTSTSEPESLIVPMFGNDETDSINNSYNGWWHNDWADDDFDGKPSYYPDEKRHQNMAKYFFPLSSSYVAGSEKGPNYSCTTNPLTPLKDVTKAGELDDVLDAIDAMQPNGNTNVPEGLAWGWHTLTKGAPFSEGRSDADENNDKIVIVLTDGANTYTHLPSMLYDPSGVKKSTYAAYGYMGQGYDGSWKPRLYQGLNSSFPTSAHNDSVYREAMDHHMQQLCSNAKSEGVIIFTVALDLQANSSAASELKQCASESRIRKDANGNYKKLYYNATGSELLDVFKAIAEELSNLRVVG